MKQYFATLSAAVLLGALLTAAVPTAATQGCVTHAEFDGMDRFLSVAQVAGRWETNGWYIGAGEERFRRGYQSCWSNDRIVIVWYRFDTGLSDDWAVRDA